MNKKQIKQDKVLKKKALYQEYWKTIFNQCRKTNEQIKDGETNTNIVEIQLKKGSIENKDLLQQGFEKMLLEQKNILKFPKHENTYQDNKIIEQKHQFKDQIKSLQDKETLISQQQNQNDVKIQSIKSNEVISNMIQKQTRHEEDYKGIEQVLKKDINCNLEKNQLKQKIQANQVVQNITSLNNKLTLQEQKIQQNKVKTQNEQVILKEQQKSLQSNGGKISKIESHKNEDKITKNKDQINSNLKKIQSSNVNQLDQSHKLQLVKGNHDITKNISQLIQQEKIINIQVNQQSTIPQINTQPKVIIYLHQENELKMQQINKQNNIQQSTQIADIETKAIVNEIGSLELKIENNEQSLDNENQQSNPKDKPNNSNMGQTQNVTRNQLKAVHKVMRTVNERLHQDEISIQIIWETLLVEQSNLIPNYEKLIECIQQLHNLEKAHFDKQKLTAQLL
ncbi:unnamed protein product [Paramecium sonneborni]|uniref:Uncharacterized protein n=1 Tax=Paramecium sonneborni TaxID=65129 RepID=A0A8S1RML6_9CILI|nr:unnamed protein product [Paramecium sonneborni]